MIKIALLCCMAISIPRSSASEESPSSRRRLQNENTQPDAPTSDIETMRRQMQQTMKANIEQLKTTNPEAYQEQKEAADREETISKILSKFRDGNLTEEEAKKQLHPLVKKEVAPQLQGVDEQIASLEKKLAFWKKVRADPDVLVRQEVEYRLGTRKPEPGPMW